MSEAEGVAKRAEEELAVAKERLLLQEDELQSRAGTPSVCACLSTCLLTNLLGKAHVTAIQMSAVLLHYSF